MFFLSAPEKHKSEPTFDFFFFLPSLSSKPEEFIRNNFLCNQNFTTCIVQKHTNMCNLMVRCALTIHLRHIFNVNKHLLRRHSSIVDWSSFSLPTFCQLLVLTSRTTRRTPFQSWLFPRTIESNRLLFRLSKSHKCCDVCLPSSPRSDRVSTRSRHLLKMSPVVYR